MTSKNLLVHSVDMVAFGSNDSIPTVIHYGEEQSKVIGNDALSRSDWADEANDDFKIDLGKIRPGQSANTRTRFECGDGELRSAYNIAADFFGELSNSISAHLAGKHLSQANHVLVSEPLQYVAEGNEDWIENYRGNIRRILGSTFDEIQFLPEPFAVYQYYRYGVRHSLVSDSKKHCALVIDFGGGTFDVSIVETTGGGDISKSGRHSRPLGANSTPTGGFEINRQLARYIVKKHFEGKLDKERLDKGVKNYDRWRNGELEIESLSAINRRFVRWFGRFLRQIEQAKIGLARSITNWSLSATLTQAETINIPVDPFQEASDDIPIRLTATELKEIFQTEIWKRRLRNCVKNTLKISRQELGGRPLDLVLLSGGSSNLKWLEDLIKEDFADELSDAHIASLKESYQEVVAKGLAIECARRAYEPNSEFSDVVYNPLYLQLNPDDRGLETPRYRSPRGDLPIEAKSMNGQLISAADYLDIQDECEITWKVRLRHPPRRYLDYFFSKSLEEDTLDERYNYIETRAHTPPQSSFGESSIRVKLRIREDGTCTPYFVYRTNEQDEPVDFVEGSPFVIDLVTADQQAHREAFVGIDFGTATSAVSYIDWEQIEQIEKRQNDALWLSINELVDLPMPIAAPLKAYVGSFRIEDQAKLAMEALEALLCFSAFMCWAEVTSLRAKSASTFSKNWKRSAGPLKKLLFDILDGNSKGEFVSRFRKELDNDLRREIDDLINQLDKEKHNKLPPGSSDPRQTLERLGNACRMALSNWQFGYFEGVRALGFGRSSIGTFRIAHGTPPFHETLPYEGSPTFSENEAALVNSDTGEVIVLTPLIFWRREDPGASWLDCLLYDGTSRQGDVEYKLANAQGSFSIVDTEFAVLESQIAGLSTGETQADKYDSCQLGQKSTD